MDVRIHDLLTRLALVYPAPHRRDPRRRRPHVRRTRRRCQPRRAPADGRRGRAARPGRVVGADRARRARARLRDQQGGRDARADQPQLHGAGGGIRAGDARARGWWSSTPTFEDVGARGRRAARAPGARHRTGVARRRGVDRARPAVGSSEDASNIFLTSGSTGVSKGAMLSHRGRVVARHPARHRRAAPPDGAASW